MLRPVVSRLALLRAVCFVALIVSASTSAKATDYTWNQAFVSGQAWNTTATDWSNGTSTVAWSNSPAVGAIFGSTGAGSTAVSTAITVESINFTAASWTLTGSSIVITLVNTGSSTLPAGQISVATGTDTISAIISGTIGLTKVGTGTLTLSGAVNTYSGGTFVTGGTLNVGSVSSLGAAASTTNGLTLSTTGTGATLVNINANSTIVGLATSGTIGSGGATVTIASGITLKDSQTTSTTFAGVIGGAGTFSLTGTGTITFSGTNTNSGGSTTITATAGGGIIALGANNALPTGTNLSIAETNITALALTKGLNMGSFSQTIGTLSIMMPNLAGNTATTAISGTGTLTLGGTVTVAGNASAYPVIITTPINLGSATRLFSVFDGGNTGTLQGDLHLTGSITSTTAGVGLTITGTDSGAVVSFGSANTYLGPTTLTAGSLYVLAANGIPATSALVQSSGTTVDLTEAGNITAGVSTTVGSLTGAGSIVLGTTSVLTVGGDNTSPAAYTGVISGASGSLNQTGNGTLTLGGANTYTGPTTIFPGTSAGGGITFSGSGTALSAGALTVGNGGTFSPTLTFDNTATSIGNRYKAASAVTLNNGNITLIGNAAGTAQTLGALTITAGSTSNIITVNSTTALSTLTFASLAAIPNGATLIFAGNNLASGGGGLSKITFTTAPTLTQDPNNSAGFYIANAYFGSVSSTTRADWSSGNGIYLYVPPAISSGTVIDNIGPPALSTSAAFTTTGNTTANTGVMIQSLVFDVGSTLTLVPTYAATAGSGSGTGNGNTPMTTLAITNALSNTANSPATQTITGPSGSIVAFTAASISAVAGTNLIFDTPITVTGTSLSLNGAGTLTINGTNSISGAYAITGGSLVSTTASLSTFTQNGGTSTIISGPLTATGAVTLSTGTLSIGTLATDNATVASFTQNSSATSTILTGSLISTGAVVIASGTFSAVNGSMTTFAQNTAATSSAFSGTLTATGAVTIGIGTFSVTGNASVGSFTENGTATSSTFNGTLTDAAGLAVTVGTVNLNGNTTATQLTGAAVATLALGANTTLTLSPTAGSTFAATLTGPATSSIIYNDNGFKLSLSGANTGFAGSITASGATGGLTIASAAPGSALGSGSIILDGSVLTLGGTTSTTLTTTSITVTANGATFAVTTPAVLTLGGTLIANGGIIKSGTGTLQLAPNSVSSIAGTLAVNGNGSTLDVNGNNLTVAAFSGTNANAVLLLGSTTFTTTQSTSTTFAGNVTGSGATFNMNGTAGGTLAFTKAAQGSVSGTTFNVNGGTLGLNVAAAVTYAAGTNFTVGSAGTLSFGTFGSNTSDAAAFGTINDSGTVVVTSGSLAAATVTLTGGSITLTGTTAALWQFRLANTTLTTLASSTTATLTAPAGSSFENDTPATLPIVVAAGTTASGVDLTVNAPISNAGTALTYNFDKQGPGAMQISYQGTTTASFTVSAGTLIIAPGSTASGAVAVNGGKLQVNGNLTSSGAVTVASGAFLEGSGTITNPVTVNGTLSGGISSGSTPNSGTLTIANNPLTFSAGSKLGVGITGGAPSTGTAGSSTTTSTDNSLIAINNGTAAIDPTLIVVITATTAFTPNVPYSYLVGTGFGTAAATIIPAGNDSQFVFPNSQFILTTGDSSLTEDASGNLYLNFTPMTAVPEPGLILLLAAGGFAVRRRRGKLQL